jgi:hypothetical protein
MCPTQRKAMQDAADAEASIFTEAVADSTSSSATFLPVADELSASTPYRQPLQPVNHWNDPPLANPPSQGDMTSTQQAEMSIEQLLAATAGYDNATGLSKSLDEWSDTGFANMMVDDELMTMWMAAPTGFG